MLSFYAGHYSMHEKELLYAFVEDAIKGIEKLGCTMPHCRKCNKKHLCRDLVALSNHLESLIDNDETFMEFMDSLKDSPFITTL